MCASIDSLYSDLKEFTGLEKGTDEKDYTGLENATDFKRARTPKSVPFFNPV